MNATNQNLNEPMTGSTNHRKLVGVWTNRPNENAVVLFSDATADREDLKAMLGRPVIDITPDGHLANVKRVVQYPIDLTRSTSSKRFASLIRGLLTEFRDARRVGVITHRPMIASIKKLREPFAGRITKSTYFGSGSDRASNDWHERCDLIVVAGTPRVPGEAVQRRLIQFGDIKSAGEDGRWGPCRWKATTETREELIVEGLGYAHPAWERAHRSLVRAAIIQAAGRGRTLLETGCDVVVVSTEECGIPVVNNTDIELSEAEAKALAVITALSEPEPYRSNKTIVRLAVPDRPTLVTSEIAHCMGLTMRGTQKILTRLESRRLIRRIGERGGWTLLIDRPSDEMHWLEKRFCATYSALCSVTLPSDQMKSLAGITEVWNGREGYGSAPIPVAQIHSLTSPCVASEPITRRLEQQEVSKPTGPHIASAKLVERLTVEDREPDPPAVPSKTKQQQLADLKLLANGQTTATDQAN